MAEELGIGGGGFVLAWQGENDVAIRIQARVSPDKQTGRLVVVELHVAALDRESRIRALDGDLLRRVRVARVEALANTPTAREEILRRIDEDVSFQALRFVKPIYKTLKPATEKGEAQALSPKAAIDSAGEAFTSHKVRPPRSLKLQIPKRPFPEAFYRRVADLFVTLRATGTEHPVVAIAEANDVPVDRVHGWLKEARRRGLLVGSQKKREV
jgi:hypothetical protein